MKQTPWTARSQRKIELGYGSATQTATQRRAQRPAVDGRTRCQHCSRDVAVKADGTLRRHGSRPGISCPGGGCLPV